MNESKDLSILFKLLDVSEKEAVDIAASGTAAKKRYEKYRYDIAGFLKYYFPEYITLEPAGWQKAIFSILEHPERNTRTGRWNWHVTDEQAALLASYHRSEYRHIPRECDALRAIALCAPREQGKSTIFARLIVIWMILYGYVRFVVYFRSSADLAESFLSDTMDEFTSNERLIKDFGPQRGSVWKDGMYSLKNGAVCVALGRGAATRGLVAKARRPDLIIMDDLTTDKDKSSPRVLSGIYDWIIAAVLGLSKNALILYLNTIFNTADPMARVQQRIAEGDLPGWLGIRLSAEIDDNTALWPEYWPMEDLKLKKAEVGSAIYMIEYMSTITDGKDKSLSSKIFIWIPKTQIYLPDYDIHFGVDPNAEGNDDAAIAVVGLSRTTGRYLTIDLWALDQASITELVDQLVAWNGKYNPSMIAWEQVAFQKVYQKLLQEILLPQGIALPFVGVDATGSKEERARGLAPFIENGTWVHNEELKDSSEMYKINNFPMKGLNDGPVDALGYAYRSFNRLAGAPAGYAGRRRSELPGLIGRYRNGY